jgi:hypothetical protein
MTSQLPGVSTTTVRPPLAERDSMRGTCNIALLCVHVLQTLQRKSTAHLGHLPTTENQLPPRILSKRARRVGLSVSYKRRCLSNARNESILVKHIQTTRLTHPVGHEIQAQLALSKNGPSGETLWYDTCWTIGKPCLTKSDCRPFDRVVMTVE